MADNKKKRIIDNATTIDSAFLQPIFGGNTSADPSSPEFNGHLHDGNSDTWGHAPKIDLTNHTTGRLVLQDQYSVAKTVSLPSSAASAIGHGVIWYFAVPADIDITKPAYFSFGWMGDSTDSSNNIINTTFQSTVFRITWQWYIPGYSIFSPAIIYDSQPPANQVGANINANTLTRGRLPNFTVNTAPFQLLINDSATGKPNYVKLTGLDQAQNSVIIGVEVDVVSTGFPNGVVFFNGSLLYLSKTIGGANININSL